jgi:phage host-nuclease inhibitor protein Gam
MNGVSKAVYTPNEKMQLIIGSNGSGKSSLLKELTPLPALRNEFTSDGYKVIVLEHNDRMYTLSNHFGKAHPHSFIIGDAELNTSGTFQVQKDLVFQHFNVTFDIYDFLLGHSNFTQYSPAERRKWLTVLSHVDYDYALKIYQCTKDQHRDIVGALKLAKARLVTHESQILSDEDIQNLKDSIVKDREVIENLLVFKTHGMYHDQLRYEQKGVACELEAAVAPLLSYLKSFRLWDSNTSQEALQRAIWSRESYALKSSEYQEKYTDLEYTLTQLHKSNIKENGDIDKNLSLQIENKRKLLLKRRFSFVVDDPLTLSRALDTNQEVLTHVFHSLPTNSNKEYSRETYTALQDKYQSLSNQAKLAQEKYDRLSADLKVMEHYKNHAATECPQCNHKWIIGYDEVAHNRLKVQIGDASAELNTLNNRLEEVTTRITAIKEYMDIYKLYVSIKQNWPILNVFFSELDKQNIILERPAYGTTLLQQFRDEIRILEEVSRIDIEIGDYTTLKNLAVLNRNESVQTLETQRDEYASGIQSNGNEIARLDREIARYKRDQTLSENLKAGFDNAVRLLEKTNSLTEQEIALLKNQTINEVIHSLKLDIANNESRLHSALTIAQSIEDIKSQVLELEDKEKNFKILQTVLSPTEGIISESITGFITTFTNQVNSVIKQIWSYPLEILPCSLEKENGDELTYRFPVRIKEGERPTPDIKKVSSGMTEVIDLAFKIVAMKYLGLNNFPLYLDEFGKGFDSHHRHMAMQIIINLLTQSDFTQIFLISHHESSYGSLRNTDINILCSDNIVIPDVYSNQLTLTR